MRKVSYSIKKYLNSFISDPMNYPVKFISNILICICMLYGRIYAEARDDMRLRAGLDLFPSFLAADMDISEKKGHDGCLLLLIICTDDISEAGEVAGHLRKIGKIRSIPIRVKLTNINSLKAESDQSVAGIFIAQPIHYNLDLLIRFAADRHAILFSPFKEDVERGVMGGLIVKEKILPYINIKAIQSAGIRIKDFFIRISESYTQ
ncbi:MAG TPA: hypothetical protein DCQ37_12180 [Desulfobacteraceae bacterium]|nr:hypothetical protein [Desulfobacteraceae bacterium]